MRIDTPSGYSHGDDLDRIFVDDDERRAWWASPRDFHGVPRRRLRWPPSLGHGVVPRLARAAWALVAVAGVAWAAWSGAKHVLFLGVGAPDFARDAAAVNAAALEAFAGLAEGALVALVIAPTCAALFALVFEAILRALVAVAAPRLPRTLAPSAAKTPAERDRRVADLNAARDIHAAFAALKTAAHSACEARQAAASSAIAAWTRPAVMIVLATASHLAALEASGVPLASALAPGGLALVRETVAPSVWATWYAGATAAVASMASMRRDRGAAVRRVAREARAREREFLAEAHRGTFSCRWRGDPYVAPGKRNQTSADKALTNAAVAAAAAAAAAARGVPPSAAPALVLDAADGRTSAALRNAFAAGFAVSRDEAGFVTETTYGAGNSVDETFDEEEESASFDDVYGGVEVVVSAPYREGSVAVGGAGISGDPQVAVGGARTPSETSETFPLSSVPLSSEDGIPIPGVSDVSAPALADVSASSPSPTGSGFPPESIFVPNVHTHAVRSLRGDFPACDAFAADVADVLARRSAGATPFHLVYLDHCGAVAQRAQQIWDVFSRHAVADGGVVAATFSTRGKRAGWTKAAAVAACARAFVEAADAHGYELVGNAAEGGGCASEPDADLSRLMDYAVRFESTGDGGGSAPGVETSPSASPSAGESVAASLREHAVAVAAARDDYLRLCDALGGVDDAFGPRGAAVADASGGDLASDAADAAARLAAALARWAEDVPARANGRAAVLDTWASRRRRRMCLYAFERVVGTNDEVRERGGSEGEGGAGGGGAAGTGTGRRVPSREDARLLASLAREVVVAAGAGAELAAAPAVVGGAGAGAPSGEAVYERCFFLYGTLMFFVFRVRVRNRRRGRGPGFGNAPFT